MTVVTILSLSGAPGVTTLACLVASTAERTGPVAVVECDPSGGDLAARFELASSTGWPSLSATVRRAGTEVELDPHLQHLPGGLPVLVGAHHGEPVAADSPEARALRTGLGDDGLAVVDLGRLVHGRDAAGGWLEAGEYAVLVVGDDPAAAVRVRTRAPELLDRTGGRIGLVVVGGSLFDCGGLADFSGLDALGDVPFEAGAAAVASGMSGAARRLERSRLLASVRRIGQSISARVETAPPVATGGDATRSPLGSLRTALRPVHRRVRTEGAA